LSKQAWGEALKSSGEVNIASYEIGVLVWPELFGKDATMVPTFKTDAPEPKDDTGKRLVIGARMPYDLPLVPYARGDVPWCATKSYEERDWMGQVYSIIQRH
jgi:tyrosyl-DNA phosphodiesterase-1